MAATLYSAIALAPAVVRIGRNDYRGEISLVLNPRGRINVVNALPLEEYLRSVVPLELSPGAYPEIEALKARGVGQLLDDLARTLAAARPQEVAAAAPFPVLVKHR